MKRFRLCAVLAMLPLLSAQQFEVVSIKPAKQSGMERMRIMMQADDEMVRYTNVTLKDVIRAAYRVKDFQVQGPDSLSNGRFEIVAKLPAGTKRDQVPEMLQAMLADRFKLKFHRETKEHSIYGLVAAKGGPKLKAAEVVAGEASGPPAGPSSSAPSGPPRNAMMMQVDGAGAHLKAPSASLATLAEMISRFSERPVVDMTGITGQYDFDLVFSPESVRGGMGGPMRMGPGPGPGGDGPRPAPETASEPAGSIYDSVKAYGLRLEPRKAPMEVLIVDTIESQPTEN